VLHVGSLLDSLFKPETYASETSVEFYRTTLRYGARGSVVGWGTMLQAGRSLVPFPMRWIFFNWPNPSSRTMALGSTKPLTEMSTRNLPRGKGRSARKAWADCLEKMWEPKSHTTLWAFTACYRDSFTFTLRYIPEDKSIHEYRPIYSYIPSQTRRNGLQHKSVMINIDRN
jgi:hypothetical protein